MDYFFVYLFGIICFFSFPFLIVLLVTWLGGCCMRGIKRSISYVRHKQPLLPQSIRTPNIHLPTRRSLETRQYSATVNTPLATHQPQNIAPEHHRPCGPHRSNSTTNTSPAVHQLQMTAPSPSSTHQSNSTVNTSPAVHQSQMRAPSPSSTNPSNSTANTSPAVHRPQMTTPLPISTHESNRMPLFIPPLPGRIIYPCSCGAHNVQANISLQALQPQIMTRMHYRPHSNNSWTDSPSPIIMESQIMVHIHRSHQSQSQTMTPLRYGSRQSNSGATVPLPTRRSHIMTPEPREGPSTRNLDITANLSSFIYQNCENGMNTECVVCLEKLQQGEKVMKLPNCSHLYHENCICRWLLTEPSCPLCRSPVGAQLSLRIGHD